MKKDLKLKNKRKKKKINKKRKNIMIRKLKSKKAVLPNMKEINLFGASKNQEKKISLERKKVKMKQLQLKDWKTMNIHLECEPMKI